MVSSKTSTVLKQKTTKSAIINSVVVLVGAVLFEKQSIAWAFEFTVT